MTALEDRRQIVDSLSEAHRAGARLERACTLAGIDVRTLQRWRRQGGGTVGDDRRRHAVRPPPAHALSEAERVELLRVANEPRFAALPPAQIVPRLADEGVHVRLTKPTLHGDNGAILKATTVLAMLHWQGIAPSYSRPRVSDDNAFVESLFRTAKYRPGFPAGGFDDLDAARQWATCFVHWYNHEHRHSALRFVAPAQRHAGDDHLVLQARAALYHAARQRHPHRWSGRTRNWTPIGPVTLNPERDALAATCVRSDRADESKRIAA